MQLANAVGQRRRPRLQDDRRLHLVQLTVPHRGHILPARPRRNRARAEFLAAPRAEDDVRRAPHGLERIGDDPSLAERLDGEIRKDIVATGDADQLRHPTDRRDLRLVPFLEIDPGPALELRGRRADPGQTVFEAGDERGGLRFAADHAAERAQHAQDVGDAALVEHVDLHAATNQRRRDVGLQVREPEHQVGLQRDDTVDLRAGECRYPRLLAPGTRRTDRETRNADDAPVLAEQVQRLGGLLGQADDARGKSG